MKKKRLSILLFSTAIALASPSAALADSWVLSDGNLKYQQDDGSYLISAWTKNIRGSWVYMDENGVMLRDAVTPDGYTVDSNGIWMEEIPQVLPKGQYPNIKPDETCSNYAGKNAEPIFRVVTDQPLVALSFDSGSVFNYTTEILDILDKYELTSTFFVTADWLEDHPEDVKEMVRRGHEMGNHSINHPDMTGISAEEIKRQISVTHQKLYELTGQEPYLFRAPYGAYNNKVIDAVKDSGYYCIQWSVDTLDWKNLGVQPIIDRVFTSSNLGNGSIILMHNGATYTPQALETLINGIQERGYEIVPVSQVIYTRDYHMDHYGNQHPN